MLHICIYIHTYIHTYIYIYIHMCMYIYIYIYLFVYMHTTGKQGEVSRTSVGLIVRKTQTHGKHNRFLMYNVRTYVRTHIHTYLHV